eukprot:TRINITY_DN5361_c0_g2_i1.p1 TRINITY_DN5361_c0_g2~~TRINITY_DN5361_c0_g2_i1.p1  ORF type:complete len:220 (+),score=-25.72 TRINITY_DN5361_c0_g2_i1:486-1145(+)
MKKSIHIPCFCISQRNRSFNTLFLIQPFILSLNENCFLINTKQNILIFHSQLSNQTSYQLIILWTKFIIISFLPQKLIQTSRFVFNISFVQNRPNVNPKVLAHKRIPKMYQLVINQQSQLTFLLLLLLTAQITILTCQFFFVKCNLKNTIIIYMHACVSYIVIINYYQFISQILLKLIHSTLFKFQFIFSTTKLQSSQRYLHISICSIKTYRLQYKNEQ